MKIVLLDNYSAVIIDRSAHVVGEEVVFEFEGVEIPSGSSLVAMCGDGISHYREIVNGRCTLPTEHLHGVVPIYIKVFGKTVLTWKCEALKCQRTQRGEVMISPNDSDIPAEFVKMKLENQEIRTRVKELEDYIRSLEKKFDDMMRGWKVV